MAYDALFIRHAESLANVGAVTADHRTVPLTPRGFQQAAELAASISLTPATIAFSPFLRARQTAEPLLLRFPAAESVCLPIQEFTLLEPTRWQHTTIADRRPAVEEYWRRGDPQWRDGPGAESFADLLARAEAALAWFALAKQPAFMVSHEVFVSAVAWVARAPSLERAIATMEAFRPWQLANKIPNGAVTKVSVPRDI